MTNRAAIYVRVSTEEQSDKNLSIPFQLTTYREYASEHDQVVVEEYLDVGSAKTDKRENFQKLIQDGRSKLFDAVIIYKYSRFARNDTDSVWYERELNRKGVSLISATELIDTTTSTGWLNKRIIQTFAEYENRQRSEYVKAGMKQKLLRGEWAWRAPLGYLNKQEALDSKHVRKWVEQDSEVAPLLARLFEEASTGRHSIPELADIAEDMGLYTANGHRFSSDKMTRIFRNPFYKGMVVALVYEVEVEGVHKAIVSEELWERVQVQIATRGKAKYRTQRHKHLLRGMVRCACGLAMTAEFHDGGRNAYLRCMSSANKRYKGCGQMGPRLDTIIRQIEEEILPSLWVSDESLEAIREELSALMDKDHHSLVAEAHIMRTRLAHLKDRGNALLELRLDGEVTRDQFKDKNDALKQEKAQAQKKLGDVEMLVAQGKEDLGRALALANKLPRLWEKADQNGRREILETVFEKFVIDRKRIKDVEVRPPYNWLTRWAPSQKEDTITAAKPVPAAR